MLCRMTSQSHSSEGLGKNTGIEYTFFRDSALVSAGNSDDALKPLIRSTSDTGYHPSPPKNLRYFKTDTPSFQSSSPLLSYLGRLFDHIDCQISDAYTDFYSSSPSLQPRFHEEYTDFPALDANSDPETDVLQRHFSDGPDTATPCYFQNFGIAHHVFFPFRLGFRSS
ncbi:hypothetical protein BDQ17DRAFT_865209 [Cyathus striatus]|nr:hypothetical protein BDQ17DRAFT_865209 [Cyathus striatus]